MNNYSPFWFSVSIKEDFWAYCHLKGIDVPIILCDFNTKKYCLPILGDDKLFKIINIPAGEINKSIDQLNNILKQLLKHEIQRNDTLFILGGGVLTDIGGLAAALYQRGIPHVNIPTTLMGMVDAAIGGKTAIDFEGIKNFVGVVKQPETCLIDSVFLKTLPEKEVLSAWSEIVKLAIIDSIELWHLIENNTSVEQLISFCAQHKYKLVQQDLQDKSIRQLLNFGHTIGHAIEAHYLNKNTPVTHGYAIAKGMLFELYLAHYLHYITQSELDVMQEKILTLLLNNDQSLGLDIHVLKHNVYKDKKNVGALLKFSLPHGIGKGNWGINVEWQTLVNVFNTYYNKTV